eukprot:COSAG05_NODE_19317_length_294_cov_1.323077_1_plen_28_part_10
MPTPSCACCTLSCHRRSYAYGRLAWDPT